MHKPEHLSQQYRDGLTQLGKRFQEILREHGKEVCLPKEGIRALPDDLFRRLQVPIQEFERKHPGGASYEALCIIFRDALVAVQVPSLA